MTRNIWLSHSSQAPTSKSRPTPPVGIPPRVGRDEREITLPLGEGRVRASRFGETSGDPAELRSGLRQVFLRCHSSSILRDPALTQNSKHPRSQTRMRNRLFLIWERETRMRNELFLIGEGPTPKRNGPFHIRGRQTQMRNCPFIIRKSALQMRNELFLIRESPLQIRNTLGIAQHKARKQDSGFLNSVEAVNLDDSAATLRCRRLSTPRQAHDTRLTAPTIVR